MKTKYSTQLKSEDMDFMDFFEMTCDLYSVCQVVQLTELIPSKDLNDILANIDVENTMGVSATDLRHPKNYDITVEKLVKHVVYHELVTDKAGLFGGVRVSIDGYLKSYGIRPDDSVYELFHLRFLGLVSYVYSLYLIESDLDIEELYLSDNECKKAINSAEFIKSIVFKGGQMSSYEAANQLRRLLNDFIKSNGPTSNGAQQFPRATHMCLNNRNSPNHALRRMAFRLMFYFKLANQKTHTAVIKEILKGGCPGIGDSTIEGYISDAKQYFFQKGIMKKQIISDVFPMKEGAQLLGQKGLAYRWDWNKRRDDYYKAKITKNLSD